MLLIVLEGHPVINCVFVVYMENRQFSRSEVMSVVNKKKQD